MAGAGNVTGGEGFFLPHIQQHQFQVVAPHPFRQFGHGDEGDIGGGVRQHLRHGLAAAHIGAQRFGQVGGRFQIEFAHHRHEIAALAFLQPRIAGDLLADGGMAAALIIVRRIDLQRRIELQQPVEQAVIQRFRIAGGQIGAAGAADQQVCRR